MTRSISAISVSAAIVVTTCLSAQPAQAQLPLPDASPTDVKSSSTYTPAPFGSDLFKNTVTDFKNFASMDSLPLLAIGAVAAGLSAPIDPHVTNRVVGAPVAKTFRSGNAFGTGKVQFASALATYAIGRVSNNPRVIDVGGKLFRAQFLAQAVTSTLKHTVNRTRPDGSDSFSFPSGHTSVTFASATVLQRELGWKVGLPAYAAAAAVGAARIEAKKHYLSDVAFGAAIGILAGRSVTVGKGNKRFALVPVATPGGAGVNFSWVGDAR